jgi:tRNA threonylcarbamoyladenosine dehydratase
MSFERGIFQRTELLLGKDIMEKIAGKKVIIFGLGGVGSWCAESLVRSGIRKLTVVDSDRISLSNINRQIHATSQTVGQVKTEALKKRLLEINPAAEIQAVQKIYNVKNQDEFDLESYDFIIDAIDSLSNKVHLIRKATRTDAVFFSSMGASLRLDPTQIKVNEFWQVKGCPFGAKIRKYIRRGDLPAKEFLCVYSEEQLENKGSGTSINNDSTLSPNSKNFEGDPELADHDWSTQKAVINGTVAHITAIFGFTLAGLVIQSIYNKAE